MTTRKIEGIRDSGTKGENAGWVGRVTQKMTSGKFIKNAEDKYL